MSSGIFERGVLGDGGFAGGVGAGAGVTELDFGSEKSGASPDAPGHHRLHDLAGLDGVANGVFFYATDLLRVSTTSNRDEDVFEF